MTQQQLLLSEQSALVTCRARPLTEFHDVPGYLGNSAAVRLLCSDCTRTPIFLDGKTEAQGGRHQNPNPHESNCSPFLLTAMKCWDNSSVMLKIAHERLQDT
jgi:hypothetical protein